jgi:hypothetical protein
MRRLALALALLLLLASPSWGAVTVVDAQVASVIDNTITISLTCTGASLLLVQIGVQAADVPPSTGTYNGVDFLTSGLVTTSGQLDGTGSQHYLYKLVSPASGTHNLTVTTPSAPTTNRFYLGGMCLAGSHLTTPLGTASTSNTGGSAPASETTTPDSAVGDLVIDFIHGSNTSGADSADGTQAQLYENDDGGFEIGASTKAGAATSTPMTWNAGGGAALFSVIAVAVKPAAGATGGFTITGPLGITGPLEIK